VSVTITIRPAGDGVFERGSPVTGEVELSCQGRLSHSGVKLELLWETSGKGTRDSKVAREIDLLPPGELGIAMAGPGEQSTRVPFSVPGVEAPLTYHGTLIKIEWLVRVRVLRKLRFDPKNEAGVVIV